MWGKQDQRPMRLGCIGLRCPFLGSSPYGILIVAYYAYGSLGESLFLLTIVCWLSHMVCLSVSVSWHCILRLIKDSRFMIKANQVASSFKIQYSRHGHFSRVFQIPVKVQESFKFIWVRIFGYSKENKIWGKGHVS